ILVRDAATLEAAGRLDTIIWDKTGTLTLGRPQVAEIRVDPAAGMSEAELLRLAAAAEQYSIHPLAKSVVEEARRRSVILPEPTDFESVVGGGVRATVEGRAVIVGNERFVSGGTVPIDIAPLQPLMQEESTAAR